MVVERPVEVGSEPTDELRATGTDGSTVREGSEGDWILAEAGSRLESRGDLELIRFSLELSPEERLAVLQDFVDTFWTPRHG